MNQLAVISAIRAGRSDAFGEAIDFYRLPVVRYLYRLTEDMPVAVELTQDVFVHAYAEIAKDHAPVELTPLLYRLATRLAGQRLVPKELPRWLSFLLPKKTGQRTADLRTLDGKSNLPESALRLGFDQRACLLLHMVEGFGYQTIAGMLEIPPAAVKTRIFAAKRALLADDGVKTDACPEMDALLSAYADRELNTEEKSAVDRHIPHCQACTAALQDFARLRENLATLLAMPPVPDMKAATIPRLGEVKIAPPKALPGRRVNLLALSLAATIALTIALPFMFASDLRPGAPAILYRMSQAVKDVTSYIVTVTEEQTAGPLSSQSAYPVLVSKYELQYAAPDTFSFRTIVPPFSSAYTRAYVFSGGRIYLTMPTLANSMLSPADVSRVLYDPQIYRALVDLRQKPGQEISGVRCFHIIAKMNTTDFIEQAVASMKASFEAHGMPFNENMEQRERAYWGNIEITAELWIGKVDYLPWQTRFTYRPKRGPEGLSTSVTTTQYSSFNQPIEVKPPLTDEGELQDGWTIMTTPPPTHSP